MECDGGGVQAGRSQASCNLPSSLSGWDGTQKIRQTGKNKSLKDLGLRRRVGTEEGDEHRALPADLKTGEDRGEELCKTSIWTQRGRVGLFTLSIHR